MTDAQDLLDDPHPDADGDTLEVEQPGGYDQQPTAVWYGKRGCPPGASVAYNAIRRRARLFPREEITRAKLADDMSISSRAVDGRLDDLIEHGWLLITPRLRTLKTGEREQGGNRYRLFWTPITRADDPRLTEHRQAVAEFDAWMDSRQAANLTAGRTSGAASKARDRRKAIWNPDKCPLPDEESQVSRGRRKLRPPKPKASRAADPGEGNFTPPASEPPTDPVKQSSRGEGEGNFTGGVKETAPFGSPSATQTTTTTQRQLANELFVVVVDALPQHLATSITASVLRRQCEDLATTGWTPDALQPLVKTRNWANCGAGGVITWLRELPTPDAVRDAGQRQSTRTAQAPPCPIHPQVRGGSAGCEECAPEQRRLIDRPAGVMSLRDMAGAPQRRRPRVAS